MDDPALHQGVVKLVSTESGIFCDKLRVMHEIQFTVHGVPLNCAYGHDL